VGVGGAERFGQDEPVIGAIAIAVVLVLLVPVGVSLAGAVMAAVLGSTLTEDGQRRNEGSELVELNR
jgi:hypothetical protein